MTVKMIGWFLVVFLLTSMLTMALANANLLGNVGGELGIVVTGLLFGIGAMLITYED